MKSECPQSMLTYGLTAASHLSRRATGMAAVPLIMLPLLSSAFVPAHTMAAGVRQFAQYQPFTPIVETLRGLLAGHPSTGYAFAALAWCVGLALVGYVDQLRRVQILSGNLHQTSTGTTVDTIRPLTCTDGFLGG